jgi:membrane fusion protein (multidrug efflux system)
VDQATQQLALARAPHTDQDLLVQRAALEGARLNLQKASAPYTPYDLRQQEQAVAQADALYRKAQNPFTEQDVQVAQAMVAEAQAQLGLAELSLTDTQVVAPVDGVIADRLLAPGAMVNPATPIVTLVPPALELVFSVDESQLGQIREGQPVTIVVPAYPEQPFTGVVKSIAPILDAKNRTASVRIEARDEEGRLRAGMFARLSITTAIHRGALLLSLEAVHGVGSQSAVMAIGEGNRVQKLPVRVGLANATIVEILSGLDEGRLVATGTTANLADGDVVAPQTERLTASVKSE